MADGKSATAVEPRASGRDRAVEVMSSISLDDVLITAELKKRGQPRSHLPRAASALRLLAQQVEEGPSDVLPRFVELAPGTLRGRFRRDQRLRAASRWRRNFSLEFC